MGLLLNIILFALVIYYMNKPKTPYIRRVPALDAIEEAVGRATEMGKPVIASFGVCWNGFDYWTLAGLTVVSHVAKICASTDTRIIVPTGGSDGSVVVRPAAVETVRSAFASVGKTDNFNIDDVPFLSAFQGAYISGYVGLMQRLTPGAVILCGSHAYEGMSITEQSNFMGAITIAGASYISNMAAMACAADYLIIGEETPAAGAYLSQEPALIASIRVQDLYKFLTIILLILGWITVIAGSDVIKNLLIT
jgi:hypothetical protein